MTIYHFNLLIPANDSDDLTIQCCVGILTEVEIYYPLNNNRYGQVYFKNAHGQFLPMNGYLTGNNHIQRFNTEIQILDNRITMYGSNSDSVYDHTIDAWLNIQDGVHSGF